jgi:hypothetical protein
LKAADYETYYSKFYVDAKQLLKKQLAEEENEKIEKESRKNNATNTESDEEEEKKTTDNGNAKLDTYSVLIQPFYDKNPAIPAFFEKLLKSTSNRLQYNTLLLLLRNNRPVPDSLFSKFANLDEYRVELYNDLQKLKKSKKFPAVDKRQLVFARILMAAYEDSRYNKADSIVFLDKLPVTYKSKKGWVYFYKYKESRDDSYWKMASVGMQPEKITEVDADNDEFTTKDDRKLEAGKPVKEQLATFLKELLVRKRVSTRGFYNVRNQDIYKMYFSEMVRNQRYRN